MSEDRTYVTRSFLPPYEEYINAIKPLWDSHWITNMGLYHQQLEEQLKEYLKVPFVSLMANGHMALELAIQSMGFPQGAEVITTPFTFISTTHAIVRNNLVPVFCDVKESDGTLDETKIEALITDKTAAIVPVHVYGHICNVAKIQQIADRHHLKVIYDAAHAFGETCDGTGIGNYGDVSAYSFHATKVFNTIEGGAIVCGSQQMYDRFYNLKNFGIRGEELVVEVGANAKLSEFAAIMGLCNLKYTEAEIAKRRERYEWYVSMLKDVPGILFYEKAENVTYNYGYMPIRVKEELYGMDRDALYAKLKEYNIYSRKYFYPLTSMQQCYGKKYQENETLTAQMLSRETLVLPLYGELEKETVENICRMVEGNV